MEESDTILLSSLSVPLSKFSPSTSQPSSLSDVVSTEGLLYTLCSVVLLAVSGECEIDGKASGRKSKAAAKGGGGLSDPSSSKQCVLPANPTDRHLSATKLTSSLQGLGFPSPLTYGDILYPNQSQTRIILRFLSDLICRNSAESEFDDLRLQQPSHSSSPESTRLADLMKSADLIFNSITSSKISLDPIPYHGPSASFRSYPWDPSESLLPKVVPNCAVKLSNSGETLNPTIIESNAKSLVSSRRLNEIGRRKMAAGELSVPSLESVVSSALSSRPSSSSSSSKLMDMLSAVISQSPSKGSRSTAFTNMVKYGKESDSASGRSKKSKESAVDEGISREEKEIAQLKSLQDACASLRNQLKDAVSERDRIAKLRETAESASRGYQSGKVERDKQAKSLASKLKLKKTFLNLMSDPDSSKALLSEKKSSAAAKSSALRSQYLSAKSGLQSQIDQLLKQADVRKSALSAMLSDIASLNASVSSMGKQVQSKSESCVALTSSLSSLKGEGRSYYTKRIMEILSSIKKQEDQIISIVSDIRELQHSLNSSSQTLTRTEAYAEEILYTQASSSSDASSSKTAYEMFCQVRTLFDSLISTYESSGKTTSRIYDIQTKTESLKERIDVDSLARIKEDLDNIKKINDDIARKLKRTINEKRK